MLNISKKRLWLANEYDVYRFNKRERGRFLNVWFPDEIIYRDLKFKDKVKHKNVLVSDKLWTLKKVDKESYDHLYREWYNPIFIGIGLGYPSYKDNHIVFDMKACIKSIDDSSYGVWWANNQTIEYYREKRFELMRYVDSLKEINGEAFLDKCVELGADIEHKDYN